MKGEALLLPSLALILLMTLIQVVASQGHEELIVFVIDGEGERRQGIEVIVSNETYRARFITLEDGRAVFRFLQPGSYEVSVTIEGVKVASRQIDFPKENEVELLLHLRKMRLEVLDLGGRPVKGLNITVESSDSRIVRSSLSGPDGMVEFRDVPYSSLSGVGAYRVSGRLGGLTVLNTTITFPMDEEVIKLRAELLSVDFKLLNLEGNPVSSAKIRLSSPKHELVADVSEGEAKVDAIPSSRLVGEYDIEVLMRYRGGEGEIKVYSERAALNNYENRTIILNVGRLEIRVIDDEGRPLRGLLLQLSSLEFGNVSRSITNSEGVVEFVDVPLSLGDFGAGDYEVRIFKITRELASFSLTFSSQDQRLNYTINRVPSRVLLKKTTDDPLEGATIKLTDSVTGIEVEGKTDEGGVAELLVLPGLHKYSVKFAGSVVAEGTIDLDVEGTISVAGIDIGVIVKVLDWVGNPVDFAEPLIRRGSQVIPLKRLGAGEYSAVVPVAGEVVVDVVSNGKLLQRRVVSVSEPTEIDIRLRGLVMGRQLVNIESVAATAAVIFLALSVILSSTLYLRSKRSRVA